MKKLIIVALVLACFSLKAQYQFTVSTNLNELTFDTLYSPDSVAFDAVSFTEKYYTTEPGKPRIPVKYVQYVLPENIAVSNLTINKGSATVIFDHNNSNIMYVQKFCCKK